MHTHLDCMVCFVRQALEAARLVSDDEALHERVVREVVRMAADLDLKLSPPVITQAVQRLIRQETGHADPYHDLKRHANEVARAALPELRARIRQAPDPLAAAVRLTIAANVIDAGANGTDSVRHVEQGLQAAQQRPFHGDVDELRAAVAAARSILFLTDNTGEIVFDRLLAEQLPPGRTTFAVRGAPVLNDATLADARFAGLHELGEVIDNGSDAPGTLLEDCSPQFLRAFQDADLIIAKGQGNYESLSDEPYDIFFLFTVKCDIAGRDVGLPRGTQALVRSSYARSMRLNAGSARAGGKA